MNGNGVGRLTRDPKLSQTNGGTAACSMRIAFRTEDPDKPAYLQVDAYGKLAEACAAHLHKGAMVYVSGDIKTPEWGPQDDRKSMAVVNARRVFFLSPKRDSAPPSAEQPAATEPAEPPVPEPVPDIPAADLGEMASIAAGNGGDELGL